MRFNVFYRQTRDNIGKEARASTKDKTISGRRSASSNTRHNPSTKIQKRNVMWYADRTENAVTRATETREYAVRTTVTDTATTSFGTDPQR